jgi:hypothetical protein
MIEQLLMMMMMESRISVEVDWVNQVRNMKQMNSEKRKQYDREWQKM